MTIPDYKYRSLDVNSIDELRQIAKIHLSVPALWINNYSFEEIEIDSTVNDLLVKSKSNNLFCYIFENNNEIISYIWAETSNINPEILNIISLWTKDEYRNKGLGTFLKQLLEDWAKKQDLIKKIVTTVSAKNLNMIKLNENLEYKISSYNMVKEL
ncbi:MAG: GNAT family N-acetyltransferase [Candidatus Cloacimonetes bacterium]|nr:GNAT family N-acetyltransferase [Candidatus Cloacimonadota bacterium]